MFTEEMLKRRIGSSRQAIVVTDEVLKVVFMNSAAESLLGYQIPDSPATSASAPDRALNLTITAAIMTSRFEGDIQTVDATSLPVTLDVTIIPGGCGVSGFIFRISRRGASIVDIWPRG